MKTNLVALVAGVLFGFGLVLSHMADPNKVLAFLDIVGSWDPSLAFVMGGAVLVFAPAFFVIRRASGPWIGTSFHLPTRNEIDGRLLGGAALLGWAGDWPATAPGRRSPHSPSICTKQFRSWLRLWLVDSRFASGTGHAKRSAMLSLTVARQQFGRVLEAFARVG